MCASRREEEAGDAGKIGAGSKSILSSRVDPVAPWMKTTRSISFGNMYANGGAPKPKIKDHRPDLANLSLDL